MVHRGKLLKVLRIGVAPEYPCHLSVTIYTYFQGFRAQSTHQECPEKESLGGHGYKLLAPHCILQYESIIDKGRNAWLPEVQNGVLQISSV